MPPPSSAPEKEKTAQLIASLSRHDQVQLLAQALLREYMHRRGLRETLRAFDAENPRDERTISSRALMRQLLRIPVDGRPSRLKPTPVTVSSVSSSSAGAGGGKLQAPTFMEELCSYRLTKRRSTHPTIPLLEDEQRPSTDEGEEEEDPSDVELRALHAAADAHLAEKAQREFQQREFEELLAAEEQYQRRKEEHAKKKKNKRKSGKHARIDRDDDGGGGGLSSTPAAGTHWQPPTTSTATTTTTTANAAAAASTKKVKFLLDSDAGAPRGGGAKRSSELTHVGPPLVSGGGGDGWHRSGDESDSEEEKKNDGDDDDDDDVDPFGLGNRTRQALLARVRAETEHWSALPHQSIHADDHATGADVASRHREHGASGVGGGYAGGARHAGGAFLTAAGGHHHSSDMFPTHPLPSSTISATVPAGSGAGGMSAMRMRSAATSLSGRGSPFSAPLMGNLGPSILVKHTESSGPHARGSGSGGHDEETSPVHSYNREARPLGSALAGSSQTSVVTNDVGHRAVIRSRSPVVTTSSLSESVSFHSPSRSPPGGGAATGGGGSGLRHGFGFRTAPTAAGGSSSNAAGASLSSSTSHGGTQTGEGGRAGRTERRVKLLVD